MKNNDFEKLCIKTIVDYFNNKTDATDKLEIDEEVNGKLGLWNFIVDK